MSYKDYRPKDVFVVSYIRIRHNKLENVCQHWRSCQFPPKYTHPKKGALARNSAPKVLKAIRMGNFKADFGVNAECYVLNDENRTAVLSQRGIGDVLELVGGGETAFVRVTSGKTLAEHLSPELIKKIQNPVKFHRFNIGPDVGNDAESSGLVDVENAVFSPE